MSLRIKETTVTASVLLVFKTAWGGRICFFKPATSSFFTAKKKNRVYWDQLQKDWRQKSKEWQITLTLLNLGAGRVTQMCLPTFYPSATPFLKVMLKSCLCASAAELSFDQHYFPTTTVCFSYNLLEEALTIKKTKHLLISSYSYHCWFVFRLWLNTDTSPPFSFLDMPCVNIPL